MNPIRSSISPPVRLPTSPAGGARVEAQRAFFAAAMGQPAPVTAEPVRVAAAPVQAAPTSDAEPQKIRRPGSLLDIRV